MNRIKGKMNLYIYPIASSYIFEYFLGLIFIEELFETFQVKLPKLTQDFCKYKDVVISYKSIFRFIMLSKHLDLIDESL